MDLLANTLLNAWLGPIAPASIVTVGLLLLARVLPLVVLTPWLRVPGSNALVSLSVTSLLWVTLLPYAVSRAATALPTGFVLMLSLLREALLGASFAVVARLPLEAIAWAGGLADRASADLQRTELDKTPLTQLYRWLGLALFVTLGGAELAITTIADGLLQVPLGGLIAWSSARQVVFVFVSLCTSAVTLGIVLSMPVLLGTFLVDVTQAIVARWIAHWPPTQLWLPLKHTVAVALALFSLSLIASTLPDVYVTSIAHARSLIAGLTP